MAMSPRSERRSTKGLQQLALQWVPAAESGFATHEDWSAWADAWIRTTDDPPHWLLDVSFAKDEKALIQALFHRYEGLLAKDTDVLLGFAWLRYELKSEPLDVAVRAAALLSDAYEASPSIEAISGALELYESAASEENRRRAFLQLRRLFAHGRAIALERWRLLQRPPECVGPSGDASLIDRVRALRAETTDLHELDATIADSFVTDLGGRLVRDRASVWWWSDLAVESVRIHYGAEDALRIVESLIPGDEVARLLVTDDEPAPWPVVEGPLRSLTALVRELPFFEYALTGVDGGWVVFDTHHNDLVVTGAILECARARVAGSD